jgi:hypothetical protein
MNIILAGIMGRYPYGGVGWCSLMYLLGLRTLGHRVWYLEDTGECNYDPLANTLATEPTYAVNFIRQALQPHGLGENWCYVDYRGRHHGISPQRWLEVCRDADLFLNLSGGCWFWRDHYASIPRKAFIDSDPAFTQLAIAKGVPWYVDFFRRFDALFTFGRNIGTAACPVPVGEFRWRHTWQPLCIDQWQPAPARRRVFTTVMTWKTGSFTDIDANKNIEFEKVIDLPRRVAAALELAISANAPRSRLEQYGWICRDAFQVSSDLDRYRHYIRGSMAEFSVAKHAYVHTRSGWFSDRTECYLAAGKPAVVQDSGFSAHLPVGEGLLAWRDEADAVAGLESVLRDYDRHCRAARDLAAAHFSVEAVLPPLLQQVLDPRPARTHAAASAPA